MPAREYALCSCCHLKFRRAARTNQYTVSDASSVTAPNPDLCDECRYHQGAAVELQLRKHQDHEQLLVERLYAADQYARKAEQEKKDGREQVASALRSRRRMAECLKQVQDLHSLRPDGSCTCGKGKGCKTAEALAGNAWLTRMLSNVALPDMVDDEVVWKRPTEQFSQPAPWMGLTTERPSSEPKGRLA